MQLLPAFVAALVAIGLPAILANDEDLVEHVEMYRAMERPNNEDGSESHKITNNNLADIAGVLRYVHQEVVPEHAQGNPAREARKYNINVIGRYRMKIRNPDSIVEHIEQQSLPGFGHYGAFDYGVLTSDPQLQEIIDNGDAVGAQEMTMSSGQIKYPRSFYWYSVSGGCPNLPWLCIPTMPGQKGPPGIETCKTDRKAVGTVPPRCNEGCKGKGDMSAEKCDTDPKFSNLTNDELMRSCCLRYKESDKIIKGGLCEEGVDLPTGEHGCVYQYNQLSDNKKDYLSFDKLVGITEMVCGPGGERKCKDWLDWRQNCHDPEKKYKKRFKCNDCIPEGAWTVTLEESPYCIEYDVHPRCQDTPEQCNDEECQNLLAQEGTEVEIGLEFWKGKCDARRNLERVETVAEFFLGDLTKKTHQLVDPAVSAESPKCLSAKHDNSCTPNPNGGPYCTRKFAGVCSRCYIPGTDPAWQGSKPPMCPFDIAKEPGMTIKTGTKCFSSEPKDLCCLYGVPGFQCDGMSDSIDPMTVPVNANGFALVAFTKETANMVKFITRFLTQLGGSVVSGEESKLSEMAYWYWNFEPQFLPEEAMNQIEKELRAAPFVKITTTKTTSTTTTSTVPATPTKPGSDSTTSAAGSEDSGGGLGTGPILGISFAVVAVVILIFLIRRSQANQRQALLEGGGFQASRGVEMRAL